MSEGYTFLDDLANQISEIPADSIISKTLVNNDAMKVVLFGFDAGQSLTEHSVSQPAMLHIVSGETELILGEDKTTAKAGAWVQMDADLVHGVFATTPLIMLLVMWKAPKK